MATVIISLGTNLQNKKQNLSTAINLISQKLTIINKSHIYTTESWGIDNLPDYLNQCIKTKTNLTPWQTLRFLQKIEQQMGRQKTYKYASRIIDLDILFYNSIQYNSDNLTVPHPQIPYRNCILTPLADIIPNFIHPKLQKSIYQLKETCLDTKQVLLSS